MKDKTTIDRLTEEASQAAHLFDQLDKHLLAKAFRGELVPQNPEDEPAEALLTRIREARATAPKPKRGRRKEGHCRMTKPRTFRVATDDAIIALIEEARARLVVIAPALSRAVADALAARFYHSRDEKGKTACLPSGNQAEIFSRLVKLGAV